MDREPRQSLPNAPSERDLVLLCHTQSALSAHLLREVLESAAIPAFVLGEHSASTFGGLTNAMPVTIHVQRPDYDRAIDALHEWFEQTVETARDELAGHCPFCGYDLHGLQGQERCPECGGKVLKWEALRRSVVLAPPPSQGASIVVRGVIWTLGAAFLCALLLTALCIVMGK